MTEAEIRKAVAQGHGRAILFLRRTGGEEFRDLILSLCLRDQEFEPWFEDRTDYMCRLVDTLPSPLELVEPLGSALFSSKDRRDRGQIRRILAHLHRSGSGEAREILLRDFRRFRLKDRQFARANDLLGFEGLELMLGEAQRLEDWEIQCAYENAVRLFGKRRTLAAFRKLAPSKVELASGEVVRERRQREQANSPADWIRRQAAGEDVDMGCLRTATEKEWKEAAQLALESSEPAVVRKANVLLNRRPWPFDIAAALAKATTEQDDQVRWWRFSMLGATRSAELRDWALAELHKGTRSTNFLPAFGLLSLNAERRDLSVLTTALFSLRNAPNYLHRAGLDILALECKPTVEMLQIIYEHGYCDFCRNRGVGKLIKRRAITPAQRAECLEDSNEETRKWAKRSVRGLRPY